MGHAPRRCCWLRSDDGLVIGEGGGLTLGGRSAAECAPGTIVLAAVRPEDVSLTSKPPGLNVARGTVRLVEYQGREYDVEIALESGATLKARLAQPVPLGATVNLALDGERVVMLPQNDGR